MTSFEQFLSPSEAAKRLGVSTKALRLYEHRGLIAPLRTEAGWRAYGPHEMTRAAEIAALRALGFSLAQVARVLASDPEGLEPALAAHETALEGQLRRLAGTLEMVRGMKGRLAGGHVPSVAELAGLQTPASDLVVTFDLPWPWGGEPFELREVRPLTYVTGPLGSGKTRFARRLAETLPDAAFLGLERLEENTLGIRKRLDADPALKSRVHRTLAWLAEIGAEVTNALINLLAGLEAEGPEVLIVDMVEQGLDEATQEALMAHLPRREPEGKPLFLMTRSSAILDLEAMSAEEAILFCPANHSPPLRVAPYHGTPGYEAVASCLASPAVRARTDGVVAWRPSGSVTSSSSPR